MGWFFRMPRGVRRFFRRRMVPRTEEEAERAKKKFAIAYAVIAWNAAGFVLYQIFGKGVIHWPLEAKLQTEEEVNERPAFHYAKVLGIPKATVYSLSGLTMSKPTRFEVDQSTNTIRTLTTNEREIFDKEFLEETFREEIDMQTNVPGDR